MGEMNKHFETNDRFSADWFPVNPLPQQINPLIVGNDEEFDFYLHQDESNDVVGQDPEFAKRVMEFESSVQERLLEEEREKEIQFFSRWTDTGLQIVALVTEHLFSHPFIVLRRQCQVNNKLVRYHLIPISLIPVAVNIHRWQGLTCLWKGVGSILILKGLTLAVQDLISKITLWPKEMSLHSSSKNLCKHFMLKCISFAVVTPFYSASLLETVQSEIASAKPEFLDIFKEGFRRIFSFGVPQKGRMLPVWSLIVPTAVYFIMRHLFASLMKTVISRILILNQDFQHRRQGAIPKYIDFRDNQSIELTSSLISVLSADVLLYPLETILHRLHLQGTRTIIDNLDDGLSVTPILTNFEGVIDCYESTIREEGVAGLYKGFGALVMQCITYTSIIKLSRFIFIQVTRLLCKHDTGYLNRGAYMERPSTHQDFANKRVPKFRKKPPPLPLDNSSDSDDFEGSSFMKKSSKFVHAL